MPSVNSVLDLGHLAVVIESTLYSGKIVNSSLRNCPLASKVSSYPNIHNTSGAGTTIAQTLPEPQAYALHVPDQVIIPECATPPHHNVYCHELSQSRHYVRRTVHYGLYNW